MSKTILITGANGTLAKKLIEKLSTDNDFEVCASSRNIETGSQFDNIEYVTNIDLVRTDFMSNVDVIVHCAFPREYNPDVLANAMTFYNSLVLKAVETNVKGIINISSQSVYGTYRENSALETTTVHPESDYALAKYACELIGLATVRNTDTKLTNIRLGSLIGIEYPERVINKIIKKASETKSISIDNDKTVFGFMDVEDAVTGLLKFIRNTETQNWSETYNFGAKRQEQRDFKRIVELISNCFKKNGIEIDLKINEAPEADKLCCLNSQKFYSEINWKPEISLKESIERIFNDIFFL